jgi:cytosine/uracil/thiamine/allantoin permease
MSTTVTFDAYCSRLSAATFIPMLTRHAKMNVSARDSIVFLIVWVLHAGYCLVQTYEIQKLQKVSQSK